MANICWGTVVFHGDKDKVNALYETITKLIEESGKHQCGLYELKEALGVTEDCDCRYYMTDITLSEDGTSTSMNVELAWDSHDDYWNAIAKAAGVNWCGEFGNDDDGWWTVNDVDKKFFKTEFYLDAECSPIGEFADFDSEDKLVDFLKAKTGKTYSASEWADLFYDDDAMEDELGWEVDDDCYARVWIVDREVA